MPNVQKLLLYFFIWDTSFICYFLSCLHLLYVYVCVFTISAKKLYMSNRKNMLNTEKEQ